LTVLPLLALLSGLIPLSAPAAASASNAGDLLRLQDEADAPAGPVFLGMGVSLGSGLRLAGPVTFDRVKAAAGGRIYAVEAPSVQDGTAIRMSLALLTSGGPLSFGAVSGRRHRVPALLVEGMRWGGPDAPGLAFQASVFGGVSKVRGFPVRLAGKSVPVVIKEGDVVVLDPVAGTVLVPLPAAGGLYAAAFSALAAYDGLKDGQALAQWIDGQTELPAPLKSELADLMIPELADRVSGSASVADLAKVRAALERLVGSGGLRSLRARERKVFARQVRLALSSFEEASSELGTASPAWAGRVCKSEQGRWERLGLLAAVFKLDDLASARSSHRRLRSACDKVLSRPASSGRSLAGVLKDAGFSSPAKARVPAEFYRRFMKDTGLESRVGSIADDVSQPLARRAERIQALIRAADLPEDLARELSTSLPLPGPWSFILPGLGGRVLAPGKVEPVKEAWADLWSRGRLAQRRREGRRLGDAEAEIELIAAASCRSSGVILSRDPASGRPRMAVAAAYGELEGVSSGRASPDQYTLGPDGKEILPAVVGLKAVRLDGDGNGGFLETSVPGELSRRRVLSSSQLASLARAARLLEKHHGWGVEVAACFDGDRLTVLGAGPIDLSSVSE
jgi:pyruvate,water dikinase